MKRTLLTSIFVLVGLVLFANATDEARYNYYDKTITRNADGSTDYNVRFSLTLFTHTAMNSTYGETFVTYNPDFQKVTINEAYTIQKNGKKVPMPERAVSDVLPSLVAKASDFNQLKEKVIIHTGLDLGSTIYLDYTIHSAPGFNKNLDFTDNFDATSPITKLTYTVVVPAGSALKNMMCSPNGTILPKQEQTSNGNRTIKYEVDSIPARSRENFQVRDMTKHYFFFCTLSDFATEMKEVFYSGIDPDIQAWADNYKKAEPNGRKRYNYIRNYVANSFVAVPVPLAATDRLRPMSQVRKGAYITGYERAALLQQMLKACNIESDVRIKFDPSVPEQFRTLNNAQYFYVAEKFGDVENILDPLVPSNTVSPSMAVGIDREIVKPSKGLEIDKKYDLAVKSSDFGNKPFYVLELPANFAGVAGWNMSVLPTKRLTDFEVPQLVEEYETYTVKIEPGIEMKGNYDMAVTDENSGAVMTQQCTVSNDGTATFKRHISIPNKIYSPAEFPAVRKVITAWMNANLRKVLFVKP